MVKSQTVTIQTEFTPNPNSLKFNVGRILLEKGSVFLESKAEARGVSALAEKLFDIPKVENVLIGRDFITISRDASLQTWGSLIQPVTKVLEEYLSSGSPITTGKTEGLEQTKKPTTDIEKKIVQILDQYIRPAIAKDGGDIVFHGFKDGVVTLYLQGSCSSCPSSIATLKSGVERMLCEYVPEVKEVIQVST